MIGKVESARVLHRAPHHSRGRTGRPSSETATMPAFFISPIPRVPVPSEFFVIGADGKESCERCSFGLFDDESVYCGVVS
jgi:hypothetical protein